jgi:hypothetical protein
VGVEDVDDLGEICKRPCQPIDLVDNDDLNLAGRDVLQKPLEGRPLRSTPENRPTRASSRNSILSMLSGRHARPTS